MSKVILFSRVSTISQDLVQQNNELYAEATRNGYSKKDIILIEQKESAIKLDEDERIGIQKLKQSIEAGGVNCVIIYEISRLSRRPKILYSIRDYLIEHNVNLICMKPYMRLLDSDGKMSQTANILFSLFSSLSESEMMIKKERMMRGRIAKRELGKFIGGNVLFGYTWDKETDKIYIDENERDAVIEIFTRYANGESKRQIAKDMVNRGRLRYTEYSTACVMLGKILLRSEYAGIKGTTYDYPPIISQELFYKVRQVAENRNKYRIRIQGLYFLQGIIRWNFNNMLMSPFKGGVQYKAWDENTNSGIMINMDYVDSVVWHFVLQYKKRLQGPEKVRLVNSILSSMTKNLERQRTAIERHKEIESTIERINVRIVKGKMSESQGDNLIEEHQEQLKELDNVMNRCKEDIEQLNKQLLMIKDHTEDYSNLTDEQKNKIIRDCVKKVIISEDDTYKGKYIEIYMMDDSKHLVHMTKTGNNFNTAVVIKGVEKELKGFKLIKRFIRKDYRKH